MYELDVGDGNMYKSLLKWVNIPFQIKPYKKRNGTGTIIFGEPYDALCYPVGTMQRITNASGAEVTSSHQLYLKGDTKIDVKDCVVFEGSTWPVQAINTFYRNGKVDCKVVYL